MRSALPDLNSRITDVSLFTATLIDSDDRPLPLLQARHFSRQLSPTKNALALRMSITT
jgi:hypothetical protein